MLPFWSSVLTKESYQDYSRTSLIDDTASRFRDPMTRPVMPSEILKCKMPASSASGPDDLSAGRLNRLPVRVRCKLFTLWLLLGWVPQSIMNSSTIFILRRKTPIAHVNFGPSRSPVYCSGRCIRSWPFDSKNVPPLMIFSLASAPSMALPEVFASWTLFSVPLSQTSAP